MKRFLRTTVLILAVLFINSFTIDLPKTDLPRMDLHVHLNYASQSLGITAPDAYQKASELSKKMGVIFGIAEEFGSDNVRRNDSLLVNRIALAKKY
jgi:hypothetical protein